ncbi:hypothetical protein [Streptomyces tailanensis]|uniref:hypothetical protein n=1 Tax=Streptomyces tailanensis TaxID=2569858 RepID=UPI00155B2261|nr:hypothetical protein [Streptomyces tailanensis]
MVSAHWASAGNRLSEARERALGSLADDVANWQDWYRRSVVADALEALHESATAHRSGR